MDEEGPVTTSWLAWMAMAGTAALAFAAMEAVAWASHKYLMHGPLWVLHRSHHVPVPGATGWQANDWFGVAFSLPSIALIALGAAGNAYLAAAGAGMAAYGIAYLVFHDSWAHGRFGAAPRPRLAFLDRLIAVHRLHHARTVREGCAHFGFLWARRHRTFSNAKGT
jgi:beta-carotene 3-hydroxylase